MSEVIGVLFAMLIGVLIIPKFAHYQQISNNNVRASVVAQQATKFNTAVDSYIQQNMVPIEAAATPTVPYVISVAMLQAAGLLDASFSATNPYGQTWQAEVLQPAAGSLQALAYSTGGTAIVDQQGSNIEALIGAQGGLIPLNDSGTFPGGAATAHGAFGGWTLATANFTGVTGGHPASLMSYTSGTLVNDYLYRTAVAGQPQLNTMSTTLNMGANSITNAANITASGTVSANAIVSTTSVTANGGKTILDQFGGAGSHLYLSGANGVGAYWENVNGVLRMVNSGYTAVPFQVDQVGNAAATTLALGGGNALTIGNANTAYYGDGTNLALRAPGNVYFQTTSGAAPIGIAEVGNISSSGNYTTTSGTMTSYSSTWGAILYGPTGNPNFAAAQNAEGSAYVNDVYLRSTGTWVSQMASIGVGQTWKNVTGARALFSNYTNSTGRPIMVNISIDSVSGGQIVGYMYVNGVQVSSYNYRNNGYDNAGNFSAIVPPGNVYSVSLFGSNHLVVTWAELT